VKDDELEEVVFLYFYGLGLCRLRREEGER